MTINGNYIDPFTLIGGALLVAGAFLVFLPGIRGYLAAKFNFKLTRPLLWIGIAIGFYLGYQAGIHGVTFGANDTQLILPFAALAIGRQRHHPQPTIQRGDK